MYIYIYNNNHINKQFCYKQASNTSSMASIITYRLGPTILSSQGQEGTRARQLLQHWVVGLMEYAEEFRCVYDAHAELRMDGKTQRWQCIMVSWCRLQRFLTFAVHATLLQTWSLRLSMALKPHSWSWTIDQRLPHYHRQHQHYPRQQNEKCVPASEPSPAFV